MPQIIKSNKMSMLHVTSLSLLILIVSINVESKVVRYDFDVGYISGSPDGVHVDNIIGINGQFPGPVIEGNVGDTLEVRVLNKLDDGSNVTIHWHGFHQRGTPFEDGPVHIAQCPLKQGSSQLYRFNLHGPGTYWYHSHVMSQYTAGLWGVIIVRAVPEVYRYDDEFTISVTDWHHLPFTTNEHWYLSPASLGAPPFPDSVLLGSSRNGIFGRYPCKIAESKGTFCNNAGQKRPLIKLALGKTYRLRLVNPSAMVSFDFSIDSHPLDTIEVDSVDVYATRNFSSVIIGAAQRYSFLIRPPPGAVSGSQYLVRAVTRVADIFRGPDPATNINPYQTLNDTEFATVTAVIQYVNEVRGQPLVSEGIELFDYSQRIESLPSQLPLGPLDELDLFPIHPEQAPAVADVSISLDIIAKRVNNVTHLTFNNKEFVLPDGGKPLLSRMIDGDAFEPQLNVYRLNYNKTVELVIYNQGGPHPLHLHGHHFFIVAKGRENSGRYNSEVNPIRLRTLKRDTVIVNRNSSLVLRWRADNPGMWTFHCHIDWHMLGGMVVNFAEAAEELRRTIGVPSEARRVCAEQGVNL